MYVYNKFFCAQQNLREKKLGGTLPSNACLSACIVARIETTKLNKNLCYFCHSTTINNSGNTWLVS